MTNLQTNRATRWMVLTLSLAGCGDGGPNESVAARASPLVGTPSPDADAVFAARAPVIDGLTSTHEIWREAPAHALRERLRGEAPPADHVPAVWRAAWDASALYVQATVRDEAWRDDSSLPWDDDSLEIYLDADDSGDARYGDDDYQFAFRLHDGSVVEAHGKPVRGITTAQRTLDGERKIEVRIPWTCLSDHPGLDWRRLGFDVHLNDDDDGGTRDRKWAWHARTDSAWTDPRTFGTLRLLHETLPTCSARDSDEPFGIQRAPVTPAIDGREDPSGAYGWSRIGHLTVPIAGEVGELDDLSGGFKVLWDRESLYLLAFIEDDVLKNDSKSARDDDSVELYVDADESRATSYTADDVQLVFGWDDHAVVEAHGKSTAGITFATKTVDGGYRLEARIPWSSLSATPATLRRRIGFDVHVNDDDDGGPRDGKLAWFATDDRAGEDPSGFGAGQLVRCAH